MATFLTVNSKPAAISSQRTQFLRSFRVLSMLMWYEMSWDWRFVSNSQKNRMVNVDVCAVCGIPAAGQRCSGCQQVSYCGKDHQRQHWKQLHRKECRCYKVSGVFGNGTKWDGMGIWAKNLRRFVARLIPDIYAAIHSSILNVMWNPGDWTIIFWWNKNQQFESNVVYAWSLMDS